MKASALFVLFLASMAYCAQAQTLYVDNDHDCYVELVVYCEDGTGTSCPSCSTTVCIPPSTSGYTVSMCDAVIAGVEIAVTTGCSNLPCIGGLMTGPSSACYYSGDISGVSFTCNPCSSTGNIDTNWPNADHLQIHP